MRLSEGSYCVFDMSDLANMSELEAQIRGQVAELDRRILNLVAIRGGLQRVLAQTLNEIIGDDQDTRWNSLDRVVIEGKILEALGGAPGASLPIRELFDAARAASPTLKYSTFRSHLHRLKERGLIDTAIGKSGHWKLKG